MVSLNTTCSLSFLCLERPINCWRVWKFNYKDERQERNLFLTSKHLINIATEGLFMAAASFLMPSLQIKRRIEISKIGAFTISRTGDEFVLHIPSEYDYRFSSEK
jgi:serum/glucocorticoid-regulated kinase 2